MTRGDKYVLGLLAGIATIVAYEFWQFKKGNPSEFSGVYTEFPYLN